MGKCRFHAVDSLDKYIFEGARRNIEYGAKRNAGQLITKAFSDVCKHIEGCNVAHSCRNHMKDYVSCPEKSNDSAFAKIYIPVAQAGKQLAYNICNQNIRGNSAENAENCKKDTCKIHRLFFARKSKNPV